MAENSEETLTLLKAHSFKLREKLLKTETILKSGYETKLDGKDIKKAVSLKQKINSLIEKMKNLIISLKSNDRFDQPELYCAKLSSFWSEKLDNAQNSGGNRKNLKIDAESAFLVDLAGDEGGLLAVKKCKNFKSLVRLVMPFFTERINRIDILRSNDRLVQGFQIVTREILICATFPAPLEETVLLKSSNDAELRPKLRFEKINAISPDESIESRNPNTDLSKHRLFRLISAEALKMSQFLYETTENPLESLYFSLAVLASYQNMSRTKCYFCDESVYYGEMAGLPVSRAIARMVPNDKRRVVVACHVVCKECYG